MKKWLFLMLAVFLVACSDDDAAESTTSTTPDSGGEAEVGTQTTTEVSEEGTDDATSEDSSVRGLPSEVENYIDAMVFWNSFELELNAYETYESDEAIDAEYHQTYQYVVDPVQVYRSMHAISFSNMHVEEYVTEAGGYRSDDLGEWVAIDDGTELGLENPIDSRLRILNYLVTGAENIRSTDSEMTFDISKAEMLNVMNELYGALYGISYDESVFTLEKVTGSIAVENGNISKYVVSAMGTDVTTNTSASIEVSEIITNVDGFTKLEVPDGIQ